MKSTQIQILKEKPQVLKNKKTRLECPCIRFFLSIVKNNQQSEVPVTSTAETHSVFHAAKKIVPDSTIKKTKKKAQVFRLPKIGCTIPFLMALFNDLTNKGAMRMEACDISKAVNTISNIKMEQDSGRAWNGNVEIAENLHLKKYKSGLVLHLKQIS